MKHYLFSVLTGYLLGCSNMALYLSKARGFDLREKGSGNPGASNAMVTMGWGAGLAVTLHDMAKGALAVFLAQRFFPALGSGALADAACVLGHMYPVFFSFRGGKGFAAYMGALLLLDWRLALVLMALGVILTLVTDYIVTATLSAIIIAPLFFLWRGEGLTAAFLLCATLPMLWKHRENIRRIREGTEIGFRRANRGDDREK